MNLIKIPKEEYQDRWQKVQEMMNENELDVVLTYSDDRATDGNAYAR